MDKLSFLKSRRFWAIVVFAITAYLSTKGFIGQAEETLIATILGGFVAKETIDKFRSKK